MRMMMVIQQRRKKARLSRCKKMKYKRTSNTFDSFHHHQNLNDDSYFNTIKERLLPQRTIDTRTTNEKIVAKSFFHQQWRLLLPILVVLLCNW
jgi:hypothetical protein